MLVTIDKTKAAAACLCLLKLHSICEDRFLIFKAFHDSTSKLNSLNKTTEKEPWIKHVWSLKPLIKSILFIEKNEINITCFLFNFLNVFIASLYK